MFQVLVRFKLSVLIAMALIAAEPNASATGVYSTQEKIEDYETAVQLLAMSKREFIGLAKQNIIGVEVIAVGGKFNLNAPARWAGHAALRFVTESTNPLLDPVISFEMLTLNPAKMYSKALDGSWPYIARVTSLSDYLSQYAIGEERTVKRIAIPTTPSQRELMIKSIAYILEVPAILGNYSYLSNNCSTSIFKLLSMVGIVAPKSSIDIPYRLPFHLQTTFLTYVHPIQMRTFEEQMKIISQNYHRWIFRNEDASSKIAGEVNMGSMEVQPGHTDVVGLFSDKRFVHFLAHFAATEDVAYLIYFWPFSLKNFEKVKAYLLSVRKDIETQMPASRFVPNYNLVHYNLCSPTDLDCRNQRLKVIEAEGLSNYKHWVSVAPRHRQELLRANQLTEPTKSILKSHLESANVVDLVQLSKELSQH